MKWLKKFFAGTRTDFFEEQRVIRAGKEDPFEELIRKNKEERQKKRDAQIAYPVGSRIAYHQYTRNQSVPEECLGYITEIFENSGDYDDRFTYAIRWTTHVPRTYYGDPIYRISHNEVQVLNVVEKLSEKRCN